MEVILWAVFRFIPCRITLPSEDEFAVLLVLLADIPI